MLRILILAAVIGFPLAYVVRTLELQPWVYYAVLVVLSFALYFANSVLIRRYIARRAPEFASHAKVGPGGVEKWELTAGSGAVPRWVSYLGLASIASLVALLFPLLAGIMK